MSGESGPRSRQRAGARTCEHRDHAEDDLLDALHGAPALGRLLVHRRVVARRVQDRDAHRAVRVDCGRACERGGRVSERGRIHGSKEGGKMRRGAIHTAESRVQGVRGDDSESVPVCRSSALSTYCWGGTAAGRTSS